MSTSGAGVELVLSILCHEKKIHSEHDRVSIGDYIFSFSVASYLVLCYKYYRNCFFFKVIF